MLIYQSPSEIDTALGIVRPPDGKRGSVLEMNTKQLIEFVKRDSKDSKDVIGPNVEGNVKTLADRFKSLTGGSVLMTVAGVGLPSTGQTMFKVCEIYEGCIVGLNALRGKAGMKENVWKWKDSPSVGAVSPCTVKAESPISCSYFTIDAFERLFGNIEQVLTGMKSYIGTSGSETKSDGTFNSSQSSSLTGVQLNSSMFNLTYILGSGKLYTIYKLLKMIIIT